ncbi:hypothetical protein TrST_g14355 [Triparma strigata]|uniref:Uracil-DNA glycosylase-like domain-containing protein n=1 Tax=Triparma strigata TaxID=1606541 RepID=A0A9W7EH05_9STRA|nr:hypothetical protein TrST_g14355 [Triparma strigata]
MKCKDPPRPSVSALSPLIGARIRKAFGSTLYDGTIVSADKVVSKDGGASIEESVLHVKFDDGDEEDLSIDEAKKLVKSFENKGKAKAPPPPRTHPVRACVVAPCRIVTPTAPRLPPSLYVTDSFAPLVDKSTHTVLLGTAPGDLSKKSGEYFSNPSNSFWRVASLHPFIPLDSSYDSRSSGLLRKGYGLFDVLSSSSKSRPNSSLDSEIIHSTPSDIHGLLKDYPKIRRLAFHSVLAAEKFSENFLGDNIGPFLYWCRKEYSPQIKKLFTPKNGVTMMVADITEASSLVEIDDSDVDYLLDPEDPVAVGREIELVYVTSTSATNSGLDWMKKGEIWKEDLFHVDSYD